MHTIINPNHPDSRNRSAEPAPAAFRRPIYDCQEQAAALKLVVYVPGVEASGVSIEARGPDLLITACKTRFVRVNWSALNLEGAQRDYRLRLRLGRSLAYPAMQAEMHNGVLTITVPRRRGGSAAASLRRVA